MHWGFGAHEQIAIFCISQKINLWNSPHIKNIGLFIYFSDLFFWNVGKIFRIRLELIRTKRFSMTSMRNCFSWFCLCSFLLSAYVSILAIYKMSAPMGTSLKIAIREFWSRKWSKVCIRICSECVAICVCVFVFVTVIFKF